MSALTALTTMDAPGRIDLIPGLWVPAGALSWTACRSGGPGGQHVNTTSSAVQLSLDPAAIVGLSGRACLRLLSSEANRVDSTGRLHLRAEAHRSQARNRADCLERLAALVAAALPEPVVRRKSKPTRGSRERRLASKAHGAQRKADRRSDEQ